MNIILFSISRIRIGTNLTEGLLVRDSLTTLGKLAQEGAGNKSSRRKGEKRKEKADETDRRE